jgi:competence protein ComEC
MSLMTVACSDVSSAISKHTQAPDYETTDSTADRQSSLAESISTTPAESAPKTSSEPTSAVTTSIVSGDTLTVHFLDVGQGASTLIQLGDQTMLIDGGGPEKSSFVVSYLKDLTLETIDVIVATHYDEDHINGLVGVLTQFTVDSVYDCPFPTDTRACRSFKRIIEEKSIDEKVPELGDSFPFGDARVTFVAPREYGHDDSNDDSIALMLEYGQIRFLITGDSSADAEQTLLDQDLKCDVLLAMHHGSNVSNSKSFLSAAAPDFVVISCGQENTYEHPGDETLSRIQNIGAHLFRTDIQGTIICTSDGESISWLDDPCNDFTPGMPGGEPTETSMEKSTTATTAESDDTDETDETSQTYVLNLNTKKFHYPDCSSVDQMAEKNKKIVTWSRDEIIEKGYVPCMNCDP